MHCCTSTAAPSGSAGPFHSAGRPKPNGQAGTLARTSRWPSRPMRRSRRLRRVIAVVRRPVMPTHDNRARQVGMADTALPRRVDARAPLVAPSPAPHKRAPLSVSPFRWSGCQRPMRWCFGSGHRLAGRHPGRLASAREGCGDAPPRPVVAWLAHVPVDNTTACRPPPYLLFGHLYPNSCGSCAQTSRGLGGGAPPSQRVAPRGDSAFTLAPPCTPLRPCRPLTVDCACSTVGSSLFGGCLPGTRAARRGPRWRRVERLSGPPTRDHASARSVRST